MNNNDFYSYDDRSYETGRTRPRKNHGGAIALLLVLVIFLSGIVCLLGILNFRMFRRLQSQETEQDATPISFAVQENGEGDIDVKVGQPEEEQEGSQSEFSLTIQQTPISNPVASEDGVLSWQEVYRKNIAAVVSITCTLSGGSATGTGVVFSDGGYIVTNCHLVEDAKEITVMLSDDRSFIARVVGADDVSDLAVLYIDAQELTAAEFGDSDSLQVGDDVVAIGDPLGVELRGTMTDGIISAINRDITVEGRSMTLIQTTAALNSGNSGGPLINCYGQVIGINTMKIINEAGVEGLGFAIPSVTVKEIVDQLIEKGFVSGRPTMGLSCEELNSTYRHYYRLPDGLYITAVTKESPAANAGISQGDMLLSMDGQATTDLETLYSLLYSHDVGDSVTLVIYRGGRQYTVQLTLTENKG